MLTVNKGPRVLIRDATKVFMDKDTNSMRGLCSYSGKHEDLDTVDIYTAGFICKNTSTCNISHQIPLEEEDGPNAGMSTKSLHASMRRMEKTLPKVVVIDHTFKKNTLALVKKVIQTNR